MADWQERTELLLGKENLEKLKNASILIVGVGGVGAYAAEMLCRAGIYNITIVDADTVSESNINRQLVALTNTVGEEKTKILGDRLKLINPELNLRVFPEYMNEANMDKLFDTEYSYVVDAIDTLSPKVALIQQCIKRGIPLVSSMGAGAKLDPTKIEIADISKSRYCPLAHQLRKRLSRLGIKTGFKAVFSIEPAIEGAMMPCDEINKKTIVGTISYLPAMFGCSCASVVVRDLVKLG